jgi:hypothetical protein
MQKIRWLDKLVDELAKGKAMEKVLGNESFNCLSKARPPVRPNPSIERLGRRPLPS